RPLGAVADGGARRHALSVAGAGARHADARASWDWVHAAMSAADDAPERRATSLPPLNRISVGMLRMPWAALACCAASLSTLAKRTPGSCRAAAAKCGAIWRHGPHQAAQKSTST